METSFSRFNEALKSPKRLRKDLETKDYLRNHFSHKEMKDLEKYGFENITSKSATGEYDNINIDVRKNGLNNINFEVLYDGKVIDDGFKNKVKKIVKYVYEKMSEYKKGISRYEKELQEYKKASRLKRRWSMNKPVFPDFRHYPDIDFKTYPDDIDDMENVW